MHIDEINESVTEKNQKSIYNVTMAISREKYGG